MAGRAPDRHRDRDGGRPELACGADRQHGGLRRPPVDLRDGEGGAAADGDRGRGRRRRARVRPLPRRLRGRCGARPGGAASRSGRRREARGDLPRPGGATRRAADAGVFGRFAIQGDLLEATATPRRFDPGARARSLAAERSTALDAPAKLDPGGWAADANAIRDRVNGLVRWAWLALAAVLFYTLAEVSSRSRSRIALLAAGVAVYLAALAGSLATAFFAS
jgi:hypothetical protein